MIRSTKGKLILPALDGKIRKGFPAKLLRRTRALVGALDTAVELDDLRSPPGNRLEKLTGDRKGQYSLRVNDQWRICFNWTSKGPENVELVDYH